MRYFTPLVVALVALQVVCGLAAADASFVPSKTVPEELKGLGIEQKLNSQVPVDVPFLDENGNTVHLSQYLGKKPAVLVLAYYRCPRLCTFVLGALAKSMDGMSLVAGKDYQVITVSIDPKETPALAKAKRDAYLATLGGKVGPQGWHFLVGSQDSITRLANAVGFHYRPDPVNGGFAHASGIIVLTPQGKVSHYLLGINYPSKDLRLSLVAASGGKIGSPVDEILLFCCGYDPTTGKYNLLINRVVMVLGSAGALVLGLFLLRLFLADRRAAA